MRVAKLLLEAGAKLDDIELVNGRDAVDIARVVGAPGEVPFVGDLCVTSSLSLSGSRPDQRSAFGSLASCPRKRRRRTMTRRRKKKTRKKKKKRRRKKKRKGTIFTHTHGWAQRQEGVA